MRFVPPFLIRISTRSRSTWWSRQQ